MPFWQAVIRDATYIHAERYNWKLSKPLPGQSLAAHRKWLDCWQNIEIADLHYFPLWEQQVHDVLQARFSDLLSIFSHYSKSVGGSTTAEDAVEMTMTEFKDLVKDTQTLTTKAAGTLSNCNSVLSELSALLAARTRLAKLECEKLELEIAALKG